jgi:DNA-binding transcriptional LysR family regulator
MDQLLETAELLAFTKSVDAQSLSRAAAELGVPRATIGRRLARLEEQLGVRLLRRTTRSLVLTDAGTALYRQARIALDAVRQAEVSVRRTDAAVRGDLRIAVPPFTNPKFHALLRDFCQRYPEVRLHVHASTQRVDLQRGGFDVAVRGSSDLEPGLVARVLTRSRMIAVASPDYLAQHGTPRSSRELKRHRCLLGFARGELPQSHWIDKKGRRVAVEGTLAANDIVLLHQMAVGGLGITYLPEALVSQSLARGLLVQVLKGLLEGETQMAIVYPEREYLPAQVRAFVDAFTAWVREEGDEVLWPEQPGLPSEPVRAAQKARKQLR